jgi:DNA (cytosine-5)-methyltransferase 1
MTVSLRAAVQRPHRLAVEYHRGEMLRLPRRADAPDPSDVRATRRWTRAQPGPTAVDLFSGAGGLSLGLQRAGFSVLVGADSDELALETHVANVGGIGYGEDLSDPNAFLDRLKAWGIRHVDLVAAGLPCQPFSRAGHSKIRSLVRQGVRGRDDPRARMWRSFLTIVAALKPRAVLVENVPELAVWDDGALLLELSEKLRALGYRVEARVLGAFDYGVPQHRRRLFVVGTKQGVGYAWPVAKRATTVLRSAIGDLPRARPAQRNDDLAYGGPKTPFQRLMRRGVRGAGRGRIHDHLTRSVRPDDAKAFALLEQGGTYTDLPKQLRRYRDDIFRDKYKRLSWNELSRTITAHLAKDGYWYIHPTQDRTLSVREAARIQTFPDSFRFAGSPTHQYRQIGNAVPPLLGEAIGRELAAGLAGDATREGRPVEREFRTRLLRWHRAHGRRYPWRADGITPWKVLMAEICLRRTRADQVAPVFRKLARIAPTPGALIENAAEVLREMRALGLHWRGRNMVALARRIVHDHGGRIPRTETELKKLPGVGEYVARSVLTFAMGRRAVLLDTNTRRIVSRVTGDPAPSAWQVRMDLYRLAGREGPDASFNYALLDLGALVCRASKPLCGECPIRDLCRSRAVSTPAQG